jgi:hypothetical protein
MKSWRLFVVSFCALAFLILCFPAAPAIAEDDDEVEQVPREDINNAVKKGVEYLRTMQKADGSWDRDDAPFKIQGDFSEGVTALCVYAMIKCGVEPNDPAIQKGFTFIKSKGFRTVYSVSCYILALEALYTAPNFGKKKPKKDKKDDKDKLATSVDEADEEPNDDGFKKMTPTDLSSFQAAINWLIAKQDKNVWRYPLPGGEPQAGGDGAIASEDASNSQYVNLAFSAARRLNHTVGRQVIVIPVTVFTKIADYYITKQQEDGPVVDKFVCPAADKSFKELAKFEKEFLKERQKLQKEEEKQKLPKGDLTTGVDQAAHEEIFGGEGNPMKSRGWCYMLGSKIDWRSAYDGSMTASGVISLIVTKAWLEDLNAYEPYKQKCDQAIRDGCAFLAHNFSVTSNPIAKGSKRPNHHYYYLYGLERVGMLGMLLNIGKHDWFVEGSKYILGAQAAGGSWDAGANGTVGPVCDTCFALLFLKRATQPLVKVPKEIYTGDYMRGKKADGGKKAGGDEKEKPKAPEEPEPGE